MRVSRVWVKNFLIDFSLSFAIGLPLQFIFYEKIAAEGLLNWLVVSIFVGVLGAFFSPIIKKRKK